MNDSSCCFAKLSASVDGEVAIVFTVVIIGIVVIMVINVAITVVLGEVTLEDLFVVVL